MAQGPTRRQALYFPADMLANLQGESMRQDRSISWLIQQAWRLSRGELQRAPSTTDYLPAADDAPGVAAETVGPVKVGHKPSET